MLFLLIKLKDLKKKSKQDDSYPHAYQVFFYENQNFGILKLIYL